MNHWRSMEKGSFARLDEGYVHQSSCRDPNMEKTGEHLQVDGGNATGPRAAHDRAQGGLRIRCSDWKCRHLQLTQEAQIIPTCLSKRLFRMIWFGRFIFILCLIFDLESCWVIHWRCVNQRHPGSCYTHPRLCRTLIRIHRLASDAFVHP